MKPLRTICIAAASVLVAGVAFAQPQEKLLGEITGVQHAPPSNGPIVLNWKLTKVDGSANLLVNSDGSYIFSGQVKDKKPYKDFDIALALKSSTGAVILFHYVGDMAHGVQWSKQGQSTILKDNFATFAKHHDYAWRYTLHESAAGKRKEYEEREDARKNYELAVAAARKEHNEKLAAEKQAEEQRAAQQEAAAADNQSALQVVGDVVGAILSIF